MIFFTICMLVSPQQASNISLSRLFLPVPELRTMVANPLSSVLVTGALFLIAYSLSKLQPKKSNLTVYVHDYLSGPDASAIPVAGKNGVNSDVLHFGTLIVVDDVVTEGPDINSKAIGRAQGLYINSALDGKGLHLVFSVIFTEGEFKGSSLEIQGADLFSLKEREFSVVSGTGYFRFVKGYGIMVTELMDMVNLRAVLKLNITVKHY
ncbi:dirigent protein 11-like [Aristolochia californica]|uniref:dirigent protein 11-like n=1 Tax=Aristolochia californica TaxID=171875 RepID=UPI0035DD8C74